MGRGKGRKRSESGSWRFESPDPEGEAAAIAQGFPEFDRKDVGKRVLWTLEKPLDERWRYSSLWRPVERLFYVQMERRRMADERRFFPIGGEPLSDENPPEVEPDVLDGY